MIFLWVPETKQRTLEELNYICKCSLGFLYGAVSRKVLTPYQLEFPPDNICTIKPPYTFHISVSVMSCGGTSSWSRFTNLIEKEMVLIFRSRYSGSVIKALVEISILASVSCEVFQAILSNFRISEYNATESCQG